MCAAFIDCDMVAATIDDMVHRNLTQHRAFRRQQEIHSRLLVPSLPSFRLAGPHVVDTQMNDTKKSEKAEAPAASAEN